MTRRVLALLVTFSLAACGGTDEGRPSGEPSFAEPVEPCEAALTNEFLPIVDFDPSNGAMPAYTQAQGCTSVTCSFNFNYDSANTPPGAGAACPDVEASSIPERNASSLMGNPAGARCDASEYATRITATNLAVCINAQGRQGWGGSLSLTFADTANKPPYDASAWDGVSFWTKKAGPATRSALIFSAADPYTAGYRNIEDPFGGEPRSCDASGSTTVADSEKCDGFGVSITVSDDWTFHAVPFDAMRQKGFGMPSPVGRLMNDELVRLQFLISAGDWDIWLDDIAFFRELEP